MNLIISRRFNDLDCWDVTEVLKVFKEELRPREEIFSPEPDNTNYNASSLFAASEKVKNNSDVSSLLCTKNHKNNVARSLRM